jgi:hypothetical protein
MSNAQVMMRTDDAPRGLHDPRLQRRNTVLCLAGHRPAYMTERSIVRVMDDGDRQPARCRSRCEARAPSIMSSRPLRTEGLYDKRGRECATVKWRPPDGERWLTSAGEKPRDLHACVAPHSRPSRASLSSPHVLQSFSLPLSVPIPPSRRLGYLHIS